MRKHHFSLSKVLFLSLQVLFCAQFAKGQFYNIYPAEQIVPNTFPLNSTSIPLAAFLALTAGNGQIPIQKSSFEVICIECQKEIINADPNILADMKIEIMYYDTSEVNTSKASIAALEYSLTPNHISSFGPDSADLLLPMTKYLQSLKIATYSPRQLSSTFSSPANFPNLRTITVSDYYLTENYVQLMKFFGWSWVAAAFADDDIGQSGRYSFAQFSNSGLYFPCFYIIGTQNNAGLSALSNCINNYTDIKVLLLWGSFSAVANAMTFLYEQTNLTYLTFIINPTAAITINFNALPIPPTFYQGSIFLSENYDEDAGFYDCVGNFINDPKSLDDIAQKAYEEEYKCSISSDPNLPICNVVVADRASESCKCDINLYRTLSKPYTQSPVLYRDILQAYALALDRIKNDCSSLKGDFCNKESITGEQLLEAVSQNSFVGFSGLISYNITQSTNRLNGTLNVYQLIEEGQVVNGDTSNTGPRYSATSSVYEIIGFMIPKAVDTTEGIFLDQSLFHFKTGGNTVPISIPTPETIDLDSGFWPCFILALSILGLVLVVISFVFIVLKWHTPTVRKAGHLFLILMLLGIGCIFTANLLWCVQVSIFICTIKAILCFLGITLCCGALFAKSVEFYIIFSNCRKRSYDQSIPDRFYTFGFSFGLLFLNSLIWYLLYIFIAGPVLCESFQSQSDFYYWYLGCLPADTSAKNLYIILWICLTTAFNFFAVILLAISWDLTTVYGLARCIVFVECNLIVLVVTILPLYYSLPEYPNYSLQQFLVRSLSSTFATYFTLLFVFAPLIYSYYSDDEDDVLSRPNPSTSSSYDPLNLRMN